MDFKNSKTYQNLVNSFAGESQARNRYSFYAEVADKEGLLHVGAISTETADNERAHAKVYFDHIVKKLGPVMQFMSTRIIQPRLAQLLKTSPRLRLVSTKNSPSFTKKPLMLPVQKAMKISPFPSQKYMEVEERHFNRYDALCRSW